MQIIKDGYIMTLPVAYDNISNPTLEDMQALGWEEYVENPVEQPPYIPQQVSMRQARLILLKIGMLETIEAIVAGMGEEAKIEWEYASVVERSNPLISAMGLSEVELDTLFSEASKL